MATRVRQFFLRDFHHLAERIETLAFNRIIYAPCDPKKVKEYSQETEKLWSQMVEWKRTVDEQVEVAKGGKGWDRERLSMLT